VNRLSRVTRVQLTAWPLAFGWPVGILATSFVINVAIFAALGDRIEAPVTGGVVSIYVVQFIVCWQSMHQLFSFTVGLNATRRTFYAATSLVALGQSIAFGLLLYVFAQVEHATGGWGIDMHFFDPLPVTHSASPLTILVYAVPMALISFCGLFLGTVTKRWGGNGFFVLSVLSIIAIGGLIVLITLLDGWPAVETWLADQSGLALTLGWTLLPTVAFGAGGYAVLRRTVP
jgi:hypothetical protein